MSYDIDSRCKTHLLDPNFSKIKFLLPPEISTATIFDDEISMKNVHFPWKSGDFEVLLVEISKVLPVEISTIFFYEISTFTGKKYYVHNFKTRDSGDKVAIFANSATFRTGATASFNFIRTLQNSGESKELIPDKKFVRLCK